MSSASLPRRVALVGIMGAGKTRVGRLVAAALRWPFCDADRMVEETAGASVAEIFRRDGEEAFRGLEAGVVAGLAERPPPFIAAMGGGVVEEMENREFLSRDFYVVWIRLEPEEAARRVAGGSSRPLLAVEDPLGVLRTLTQRRDPLYAAIADMTLTTGSRTRPEDLRDAILDDLERG